MLDEEQVANLQLLLPKEQTEVLNTEDTVKIASSRANASNEINNHTTQKEIIKDWK